MFRFLEEDKKINDEIIDTDSKYEIIQFDTRNWMLTRHDSHLLNLYDDILDTFKKYKEYYYLKEITITFEMHIKEIAEDYNAGCYISEKNIYQRFLSCYKEYLLMVKKVFINDNNKDLINDINKKLVRN